MTAAHFHLALNHVPLFGILIGALLLGYGMWRNHEEVQKASLGLLAVAGLAAIAVYLTGEPAEEVVEGLAGVSHDAIETHEHFGLYSLVAGTVTAVASLGALIVGTLRQQLARWTVTLVLLLALATAGLIGYTANLGGKVSHPELQGEAVTSVEGTDQEGIDETEETAEESEHEEGSSERR